MAEPADSSAIVRAGVDPITGSPLSAESRQAIFNRATISSAAFRGNTNLIAPQRDSQETVEAIQSNQQTLSGVQQQIISVRQEIGGLNAGLNRILTLLQEESNAERTRIEQQQESERRLAEAKIRLGKEDEFENKIQQAIVAPVNKLAPRVTDLFGGVTAALSILFAGWLTNQTIEYLKAEGEKNTEKLRDIKNNILKNVGIAAGVIVAIRAGFAGFTAVLRGVIGKIGSLLGKIVAAPFKGAAALATTATNVISGKGPKPGGGKPTPPPKPSGGPLSTVGNVLRGAAGPLLTGAALTGFDIASGEDPARAAAGAAGGMVASTAAFTVGSLLPIPGSGLLTGALAYQPGADFGKGLYDMATGKNLYDKPQESPSTPTTPKVEPKTQSSTLEGNPKESQPAPPAQPQSQMIPPADLSSARPSYNTGEVKIEGQNTEEQKNSTMTAAPTTTSAEISPTKQGEQKVTTLPEPKPTVIMPTPPKVEQPSQPPMNAGPLADVPLIPSANPDNFYVLYSQMHYNVVM